MKNKFFKKLFKHRNISPFKKHGRFKSGFRPDLGVSVRSGWEANYARFLKYCGYEYKFEPRMFLLSTGEYYLPDFYIPEKNLYIELKGQEIKKGMDKFYLFKKEYSQYNAALVDSKEYHEIEKAYKKYIKEWE